VYLTCAQHHPCLLCSRPRTHIEDGLRFRKSDRSFTAGPTRLVPLARDGGSRRSMIPIGTWKCCSTSRRTTRRDMYMSVGAQTHDSHRVYGNAVRNIEIRGKLKHRPSEHHRPRHCVGEIRVPGQSTRRSCPTTSRRGVFITVCLNAMQLIYFDFLPHLTLHAHITISPPYFSSQSNERSQGTHHGLEGA